MIPVMTSSESPFPPPPSMIVFTDLDGTLLDHDSYSHAAALPALNKLRALQVPVVLASSKTAAEIAVLRHELNFDHVPAIVENGAGVLPAGTEAPQQSTDYTKLRTALARLPIALRSGYQGFGDWGDEGVAHNTGLPLAQAKLATQRQFSEPGLWTGPEHLKQEFLDALAQSGIAAREGGRFLTLSFGGTKAAQMGAILAQYETPFSVALGDAPNDVEMLETADLGVVIANPHRAPLPQLAQETQGKILRTELAGPSGWNQAMLEIIAQRHLEERIPTNG